MREIKFRCFDHEAEEMISPDELLTIHNNRKLNESLISDEVFSFMQFTGLTDKNGFDIYEGDVVEFSSHWDKHVCTVSFSECKFGFGREIKGDLGINGDCDLSSFMRGSGCNGYTVIGNIHQNPELLEQNDE